LGSLVALMRLQTTPITDLVVLEPRVFADQRGFFMETFRQSDFAQIHIERPFVQDNHSGSRLGTLRGLHYQIEQPQGKLVRVVRGAAFDVAVDLRRSSPTFGQWFGITLSEQNRLQLFLPPGLAHGFCVTTDYAEIVYKCTDYYLPSAERTVVWNDPDLGIAWPSDSPVLSEKDRRGTRFCDAPYFD